VVTQLSELERKRKKKYSEPNRFSADSKSWLLFKAFNGTEDSYIADSHRLTNQLLKFVGVL